MAKITRPKHNGRLPGFRRSAEEKANLSKKCSEAARRIWDKRKGGKA